MRISLLALTLLLGLAACGTKGPLVMPPRPAASPPAAQQPAHEHKSGDAASAR